MANRAAVEAVDTLLQSLNGSTLPFGGVLFLGFGDFRQVAPGVKNQYKTGVLDSSIISDHLWPKFKVLRLHDPIRNARDPEFSAWVDSIGDNSNGIGSVDVTGSTECANLDDAKAWLFSQEILSKPEVCAQRAYLTPLNVNVDQFNNEVFQGLNVPSGIYFVIGSIDCCLRCTVLSGAAMTLRRENSLRI